MTASRNLKSRVDTLITIPNQRLLSVGGKHMTIKDAFFKADEVLLYAVRSISDLIVSSGHVNVDFADVKTVMSEKGMAIMGVGVSSGDTAGRRSGPESDLQPAPRRHLDPRGKRRAHQRHGQLEHDAPRGHRGIHADPGTGPRRCTGHMGPRLRRTMDDSVRITVIATGFGEEAVKKEEKPERTGQRETLLENGTCLHSSRET